VKHLLTPAFDRIVHQSIRIELLWRIIKKTKVEVTTMESIFIKSMWAKINHYFILLKQIVLFYLLLFSPSLAGFFRPFEIVF
jgi:hypothetical protein